MRIQIALCAVFVALSLTPSSAQVNPATAGRVTGRAVFRGTIPPRVAVNMKVNPYCVKAAGPNTESEDVLVGQDGGLQNVFVYIKDGLAPGYFFESPAKPVGLDQQRCQFTPRVVGVQVAQPLVVVNSDHTLHNVHARPSANQPFNIGQPIAGMRLTKTFAVAEVMIPLTSDIHPWMAAFVGVLPHPFFAVSDPDGSFEISNVPPGTYTIEAWHEKFGRSIQRVIIGPRQSVSVSFAFPSQ